MKSARSKKTKVPNEWTESTVLDAIESQHEGNEKGIFLRGVRDATGFGQSRTADGLYMGCWQSVGIQLHGFEVKISRGDWIKEIQDVAKAACFEKYCHYWWIAVPDGIVELAEMPAQWGLKIVSKNTDGSYSVRVKKAATRNDNANLDYAFFASCLRKCRREDPAEEELKRAKEQAYKEGREAGLSRNNDNWERDLHKNSLEQLRAKVREFETMSGVRLDHWGHSTTEVGKAVRYVLDHGIADAKRLQRILMVCDRIGNDVRNLIQEGVPQPIIEKLASTLPKTDEDFVAQLIAQLSD